MKVLITGASGLLGAKLTETATKAGHEVLPTYNEHSIASPNAVRLDLRNPPEISGLIHKFSPDVVIHSASLTDVDQCEREPKLAFEINGTATGILAKECARTGSHLVYVSTDYVFDGQHGNYVEEDQPDPVNVYGSSKLAGEKASSEASESFCVARTSVVYGWGRPSRHNFATWVCTELKAEKPLKVMEGLLSSPTLNSHLAKMLLELAEKRLSGTFHLAGASRISRYQFAQEIARELTLDLTLITPISSKPPSWIAKRPSDSSLNVQKAQRELANKPVSIKEALRDFVRETAN